MGPSFWASSAKVWCGMSVRRWRWPIIGNFDGGDGGVLIFTLRLRFFMVEKRKARVKSNTDRHSAACMVIYSIVVFESKPGVNE